MSGHHTPSGDEPPPRPERFDMVLLGRFFDDWRRALAADSDLWKTLPVTRVLRKRRGLHFALPAQQAGRILFPVRESSLRFNPRGGWGLFPTQKSVETLGDKLALWTHVAANGLSDLMPETWVSPEDVTFPVMLKLTDKQGSNGVFKCDSPTELAQHLHSPAFAGKRFVIQHFVPGPEFTLHGVAVDGTLVWTLGYHHPHLGSGILQPGKEQRTVPIRLSEEDIAALSAMLRPLGYSGPVNIDFKRTPSGRPAVLEVNPRFGGSLFRPYNHPDLITAVSALIENVRWLGWQSVMRLPFLTH